MNVRPPPLARVPLALVPWAAIALCVVGCQSARVNYVGAQARQTSKEVDLEVGPKYQPAPLDVEIIPEPVHANPLPPVVPVPVPVRGGGARPAADPPR